MIDLVQNLACLRDRLMVKIAQNMLAKPDRMFDFYWCLILAFSVVGACLFPIGLMAAGYGHKVGLIVSVFAPVPVCAWVLMFSPWMQRNKETFEQCECLNQVVAGYDLMSRNHYTRAEAWLAFTYLAPEQRMKQSASQLDCITPNAPAQCAARRL